MDSKTQLPLQDEALDKLIEGYSEIFDTLKTASEQSDVFGVIESFSKLFSSSFPIIGLLGAGIGALSHVFPDKGPQISAELATILTALEELKSDLENRISRFENHMDTNFLKGPISIISTCFGEYKVMQKELEHGDKNNAYQAFYNSYSDETKIGEAINEIKEYLADNSMGATTMDNYAELVHYSPHKILSYTTFYLNWMNIGIKLYAMIWRLKNFHTGSGEKIQFETKLTTTQFKQINTHSKQFIDSTIKVKEYCKGLLKKTTWGKACSSTFEAFFNRTIKPKLKSNNSSENIKFNTNYTVTTFEKTYPLFQFHAIFSGFSSGIDQQILKESAKAYNGILHFRDKKLTIIFGHKDFIYKKKDAQAIWDSINSESHSDSIRNIYFQNIKREKRIATAIKKQTHKIVDKDFNKKGTLWLSLDQYTPNLYISKEDKTIYSRIVLSDEDNAYNIIWLPPTNYKKFLQPTTPEHYHKELRINSTLNPNERIYSSNLLYYLVIQKKDGHLVLYDVFDRAIWASGKYGKDRANSYLIMQTDGNLVEYTQNSDVVWASGTDGRSGHSVRVSDDGYFAIYDVNNKIVWHSAEQ